MATKLVNQKTNGKKSPIVSMQDKSTEELRKDLVTYLENYINKVLEFERVEYSEFHDFGADRAALVSANHDKVATLTRDQLLFYLELVRLINLNKIAQTDMENMCVWKTCGFCWDLKEVLVLAHPR